MEPPLGRKLFNSATPSPLEVNGSVLIANGSASFSFCNGSSPPTMGRPLGLALEEQSPEIVQKIYHSLYAMSRTFSNFFCVFLLFAILFDCFRKHFVHFFISITLCIYIRNFRAFRMIIHRSPPISSHFPPCVQFRLIKPVCTSNDQSHKVISAKSLISNHYHFLLFLRFFDLEPHFRHSADFFFSPETKKKRHHYDVFFRS